MFNHNPAALKYGDPAPGMPRSFVWTSPSGLFTEAMMRKRQSPMKLIFVQPTKAAGGTPLQSA